MNFAMISFTPALPWPALMVMGAVALALTVLTIFRRGRGGVWRGLGFLLLLAILAGPHWSAQTARKLPDIALILTDHSQSMQIGDREADAAKAVASLTASAGGAQIRFVDIPPADDGGTALFAALRTALASIPAAQLAGIAAITDGDVADPPASLKLGVPFTALLAARGAETDRELRLLVAPAYALAGQNATLRLVVIDHGVQDAGATAAVTVTQDGVAVVTRQVTIGQPMSVSLPVTHAGPAIIAASVQALPGEVSLINNQAAFTVNGIHKRLTILLISGSPDQGERSWRLLLKSDPAVELVHFTILRLPGEPVNAEAQDLALVPFPVRQLFETDIGKFDLIIMDRFNTAGLLPPEYFANIAAYVQNGGAFLAELGPEFSTADSLAFTPLGQVLLAAPADPGTISQPFEPAVTGLGSRHPVTAPLAGLSLPPWYRIEATQPMRGDVLMSGAGNAPLLILGASGKGRVGMLCSDQFWLWTRGGVHDGPALPLLRRIVHWLLREPDLEAESLAASFSGGQLVVTRQTIAEAAPGDAMITTPDDDRFSLALKQTAPGRFSGSLPVPVQNAGVWKVSQGNLNAYAANNATNGEEYQDLAATDEILRPFSRKIIWLGQTPEPALAPLLTPRHATEVTGTRDIAILPPLPAMLLTLALFFAAWWREND